MDLCFTENIWENHNFQMFVFSHSFPLLGIKWISASPKLFKKPINWKCLCFPMPFPYFGIHFSYVLGTAWISASLKKKLKKPLTLKYWCFPIFFSYYGDSLFPYFGNCMDFCFTQNIWENHNFGMFVFSHTFHVS